MLSPVVSALLGAAVGFSGTYALQKNQFRRTELDGFRDRMGTLRSLRADLYVSKLLFEGAIRSQGIAPGVSCPVDSWVMSGGKIMGAVTRPAAETLNEAFGRLRAINGTWAAIPGAVVKTAEEHEGGTEAFIEPENLHRMIDKINAAISTLDTLEKEYERRELRLSHPIRSRLPEAAPLAMR